MITMIVVDNEMRTRVCTGEQLETEKIIFHVWTKQTQKSDNLTVKSYMDRSVLSVIWSGASQLIPPCVSFASRYYSQVLISTKHHRHRYLCVHNPKSEQNPVESLLWINNRANAILNELMSSSFFFAQKREFLYMEESAVFLSKQ